MSATKLTNTTEQTAPDFASLCDQGSTLPIRSKLQNALAALLPKQRPVWISLFLAWLAERGNTTFRPLASSILQEIPQGAISRAEAVKLTIRASSLHENFRQLISQADAMRDSKQLSEAEGAYVAALRLFPLHGNYRVQLAHMLKDQGKYTAAFVEYCFALGSGAADYDVEEHLRFVANKLQNHPTQTESIMDAWKRMQITGDDWDAPPIEQDFKWFARLLWGDEGILTYAFMHNYLLKCSTRKSLFLALIAAPETIRSNRRFFIMMKERENRV